MNKETLKLFLYLHTEISPVFNCKVFTTESAIQGNTIVYILKKSAQINLQCLIVNSFFKKILIKTK